MKKSQSLLITVITLVASLGTLHATDYSWNSAGADVWSNTGAWSPTGAPGSSDTVVTPTQFGELRLDGDYTITSLSLVNFGTNWNLRNSSSAAQTKTLIVTGVTNISGDGARSLGFFNNGSDGLLNLVFQGAYNHSSSGIVNFGDRFTDFNNVTFGDTVTLTADTSASVAMRINANQTRFNGGVVFDSPGSGPIQFTIANDDTRAGDTEAAYISGGDSQSFIQANETGTGTPTAPDATLKITGNTGGTYSFGGILRDWKTSGNTAKLHLSKSGSNTQVLSGNNEYTGTTTVSGGTLIINGFQSTATGAVSVASGATLGGSGTIGGATTVDGILSPGDGGIGTLSVNANVSWNGGASASSATDWIFELGASETSDSLAVTGDFDKGTGSNFRFDFGASTETGTFTLVTWTGLSDFTPSDFSYTNLGGGNSGYFQTSGNSLQFVVSGGGSCTSPNALSMSNATDYCTDDGAQVFGVTGATEADVDYELKLDGLTVDTVTGTGSDISFAAQTAAGSYLVVGVRGECTTAMIGAANIYAQPTVEAGPDQQVGLTQDIQLAGTVGGSATGGTWSGGAGAFSPDANTLDAVYTPTAGERSSGSLILTLTTTGQSSPCTAVADTMTITFGNVAPVAQDQEVVVPTETPIGITLTADDEDEDPLTFEVLTQPSNGLLSGTAPDLTYTPDNAYQGPDSFTFRAFDGTDYSNTATVSLSVQDAPAVPGAGGQFYRFYFIGNSLTLGLSTSSDPSEARFHNLFKSRGNIMEFGTQLGAGVNLDEHWQGRSTFTGDYMKQSYMDDMHEGSDDDGFAGPAAINGNVFFRDYNFALQGNRRDADGTILTGQQFTAVVLQPYQSLIEEDEYTASQQSDPTGPTGDRVAINNFIDYATGNNPSSHAVTNRFHIYSPWPSLPGIENKAEDTDVNGVYSFEEFYLATYSPEKNPALDPQAKEWVPSRDYLTTLYNAVTSDNPGVDIRLIPVGEVAMALDILIRNDQLPGIENYFTRNAAYYLNARLNEEASLADAGFTYIYPAGQPANFTSDFVREQGFKNFYCDGIHMNNQTHNDDESGTLGAYMAAATVYACLTGENPNLVPIEDIAAYYEKIDPVEDAALVAKIQEVVWDVVTSDARTGVADLEDKAISFPAYQVNQFTYQERDAGDSDAGADPDGDNLVNALEFFLQTGANQSDYLLPIDLSVSAQAGTSTVSFTGLSNPRGVIPYVEYSDDLQAWNRISGYAISRELSTTPGMTDYSASIPVVIPSKKFYRMGLHLNPAGSTLPLVNWDAHPDVVQAGVNLSSASVGTLTIDLNNPANPTVDANYGGLDSPVFYLALDGLVGNSSKGRIPDGDATVSSLNDRIVISFNQDAAPSNDAVATMIWTQSGDAGSYGFLNGADSGNVRLSDMELIARVSARTTNVNQIRFVIRQGSDFYISDLLGGINGGDMDLILLRNLYSVQWFEYDPVNSSILTIGNPVTLDSFDNITAVGFNYRTFGSDPFRQFWIQSFKANFYE